MFERKRTCVAVGLALAAAPVAAQQPAQLDRVEITGTAIKRVDAETALPVQVISRDEIARSGVSTTEQLLQNISAVSSQGSVVGAVGAGNSTYGASSVSLRGLRGERTLVLVNGRRLALHAGFGAYVNINAIPLSAIERVEVLKDGASAVYGSDSVGGVINFILTRKFEGLELSATANEPTRGGGGESQTYSAVAGFGDLDRDRFNVTFSGSFTKENELFGRDRDFSKTGTVLPYFVSGATGQGNIEGGYTPGTGSVAMNNWVEGTRQPGFGNSPATGYGNPLAATNNCAAINMFRNPTDTTRGFPFCAFDSAPFANLIPEREGTHLSLNGAFRVNDKIELFGDLLWSKIIVTTRIQPSPIRRSFLTPSNTQFQLQGVDPALLLFPTNPNYSIAANYLNAIGQGALVGQPLAITARVFDFGLRTQRDESEQQRVVAGVRGNLGNHDYEVALFTNESTLTGTVPDGYFSQVAYARAINSPTSDWNPWSLNQSAAFNAAIAGAKYTGATGDGKSKDDGVDAKLTGEAFQLPAGMSQYAVGATSRKTEFKFVPSPALATGDIAGLGGATPPVDRDRRINAFYGEFNAPIIKGLEATLSARQDRYNDVGNADTYKVAGRWQVMPSVLFRASYGTGFRAPTLVDLWQPQVVGTSEQFDDPATGQTDLQVPALVGGNPLLMPEKSKQSSIGVVLSPIQNLNVLIDLFQIRVEDIISSPSAQEVVSQFRAGNPAFAGLVTLDGNDVDQIVQTTLNAGEAKIRGFDVEVNYRQRLSIGTLELGLSGTYMDRFDQTTPGGVLNRKVGTLVTPDGVPVVGAADTGGVVLRWKHILTGTWSVGNWSFTAAQNFYKGYRAGNDLNGNPTFVPDEAIYDVRVGYTGIKNLRIALGAKNVFDKDPPIFVPVSNQFQAGYDISQYDPRARFIYLTAAYRFF